MDGYNNYNQVKMAKKDKENTTFISEWGAYAYNIMDYVMLLPHFKKWWPKPLKNILKKIMQVFRDDFNVYGSKKGPLRSIIKMLGRM